MCLEVIMIKQLGDKSTIRIINGNHKDKFRRKYILKIIFCKKGCCKDDIVLLLNITNSLPEFLELKLIFKNFIFL